MIPKQIPPAQEKHHWKNSDIFSEKENLFVRAFVHENYSMGMHTHAFTELNIVLGGRGGHYIESNAFELQPGDVFVIPPGILHGYYNSNKLDVFHMLIHESFLPHFAPELMVSTGYTALFEVEPMLRNRCAKSFFLQLPSHLLEHIIHDAYLFEMYKKAKAPTYELCVRSAAIKMLNELCLYACDEVYSQSAECAIAPALNKIHARYFDNLTVSELASLCNMSKSTFLREFKSICKTTPHQYITDHRVKTASTLINQHGKSYTEAASSCGFYDASHLRRAMINAKKGDFSESNE